MKRGRPSKKSVFNFVKRSKTTSDTQNEQENVDTTSSPTSGAQGALLRDNLPSDSHEVADDNSGLGQDVQTTAVNVSSSIQERDHLDVRFTEDTSSSLSQTVTGDALNLRRDEEIGQREATRESRGDHKCCTKHKLLCWSGDHKKAVTHNTCTKKVRKRDEEQSLLKFLALNALELTAPASDVLLRQGGNQTTGSNNTSVANQWFQLSGHPDAFAPAGPGTVWKKCSGGTERAVYEALSLEPALQDVTPRYLREVQYGGQTFIELEDLLHSFRDPNVMDIKMGRRTFLEDEVQNTKAREDLYKKMVKLDPNAPTEEEHKEKAITKLRYMQFREEQSSTCSHGFRIEAMKFRGSPPVTDLKCVKSDDQIMDAISLFLGNREDVRQRLIVRLNEIRTKLESSKYFKQHEVVGSSLLLMYDDGKVGAWLIDFAKTRPVPTNMPVNHRSPWTPGNHEEGFLYGLDQLIQVLEQVKTGGVQRSPPPTTPVALKS